jgi:hypothetical protein
LGVDVVVEFLIAAVVGLCASARSANTASIFFRPELVRVFFVQIFVFPTTTHTYDWTPRTRTSFVEGHFDPATMGVFAAKTRLGRTVTIDNAKVRTNVAARRVRTFFI